MDTNVSIRVDLCSFVACKRAGSEPGEAWRSKDTCMPAKTTKTAPPSRTRASKAEVQHEFNVMKREAEVARELANPKSEEAAQRYAAETRQSVEDISVDSVAQQISAVGSQVSRTLNDLTDKLTAEVGLLGRVREAVQLVSRNV